MSREILSTARPTKLRLAGFLCLAVGAVAAGYGATADWVAIGFPADIERVVDVTVRGTDVWEGKVVFLGAVAALMAMLAMRLSRSQAVGRSLAVALMLVGLVGIALPVLAAVRAEDRFGGGEGVDLLAEQLAAQLELPEDVVREQLREEFQRALRVEVEPGIWISTGGGTLLVIGGALSFEWVRRRSGGRLGSADPGREAERS
ncbi:MAG: hypothetical protein ACRDHC_03135 [Actinomycetota bacterium]